MKTVLAAVSFTLITVLSGVSATHAAGFNDQSAVSNAAVSAPTGPQDCGAVQWFKALTSKATTQRRH